jgi:hypothetical protein
LATFTVNGFYLFYTLFSKSEISHCFTVIILPVSAYFLPETISHLYNYQDFTGICGIVSPDMAASKKPDQCSGCQRALFFLCAPLCCPLCPSWLSVVAFHHKGLKGYHEGHKVLLRLPLSGQHVLLS